MEIYRAAFTIPATNRKLDKMSKRKEVFLLVFLVLLLFAINYRFLDTKIIEFLDESDSAIVERVIDGDTIVVSNNTHIRLLNSQSPLHNSSLASVRLLGINTPEKKEFYYQEAKDYLNNLILNKTIKLEYGKDKTDLYRRTLAYIILDGKNINIELVKNGFANFYIYNNDKNTNELKQAWNECILKNINLCEKSNDKCASCIELKSLDVKTQTIIFYNNCSFDCNLANWNIKDEGRKNFYFPSFILKSNRQVSVIVGNKTNSEGILFWNNERYNYVWTSTGDTLFLRDDKGKLILFKNY